MTQRSRSTGTTRHPATHGIRKTAIGYGPARQALGGEEPKHGLDKNDTPYSATGGTPIPQSGIKPKKSRGPTAALKRPVYHPAPTPTKERSGTIVLTNLIRRREADAARGGRARLGKGRLSSRGWIFFLAPLAPTNSYYARAPTLGVDRRPS